MWLLFKNGLHKLKCLSLTGFQAYLFVMSAPHPRVDHCGRLWPHLETYDLAGEAWQDTNTNIFCPFVNYGNAKLAHGDKN